MTSHAGSRNGGMLITRNEISMPKWVTEQSNRIGPKPPPPPVTPENVATPSKQLSLPPKTKQAEPDYEVIEFSNQQYSNTPMRPNSASSGSKSPDNKLKCTLCGSGNPWVTCDECAQQLFCASCDDMFHKHPKRKGHQRKTIEKSLPPLPPKVLPGQPGPSPPVAPPRRNKRGLMTPLMQRKDQGNSKPGAFPEPTSPTPTSSLQDRIGSLPRGLNFFNRPLPETPKTPSESSRSTTPKSVFDNIQRPPSVVLEKIKSKANATLDRMQILQQRYRQQKEQMERDRCGSVTDQRQMALQHHQMVAQRTSQLGQRGMSSSVFNLSQMNRKQPVTSNGWINNSMQQAQSMAHINCGNCGQHQLQWNGHNQHHMQKTQDPWSNQLASQQHLNRSNMSLNVPAGYMMQPQMNNMYPPPAFMNQRNFMPPMYPQPYLGGMPAMNPGLMCMPPSTSRAASRAGSRLASPAMSRKSVTLRRKQRSNYIDDEATDDEDSDEDDSHSTCSGLTRPRQRRMSSASQFQLENDIESTHVKLHRNRVRNQRRDSAAKSVHNDWAPGRKASLSNNNRSADSGFNSPLKPSRIYSDLDSEGSGTRALVQAKIEQKLKEDSFKQKQLRCKRQSKSPPPQKTSSAVQTPAVKQTKKYDKIENHVQEPKRHVKKSSESEKEIKNEHKEFIQPLQVLENKVRATKEERETENESKSELSEESDVQQQLVENDNMEENEAQEDELGPPPSTPDHEWECEFCTFVNEANIKICTICCKTPSVQPKKATKTVTPPKQLKNLTNQKENKNTKKVEKSLVNQKSGTIKKSPLMSSKPTSDKSAVADGPDNYSDGTKFSNEIVKNKESVEDVWASLDENIQATAHEVTLKAQTKKSSQSSTSEEKPVRVEPQENDLRRSQAREIGTSPPPQTISTQTYDTLPLQKTQSRSESASKQASQTLFDDVIHHTNLPLNSRTQDLRSFEDEVLNNIHNISHVPSHSHNHHLNHPMHFYNERQRYRSNNNLHMDDTLSVDFEALNSLGKQQPSISELMTLHKTSSQMHSPSGGSTYDLPYRELSSIRPKDMEIHKESDIYKHTPEELNAAIKYCGPDMHPLVWLRDNWPKLIQTVQSLATKYGQERAENTIGTISQMEAREALRKHTGNIWQAVSECIEQRQRKYSEISSKGNFSREDIVTALTSHHGNVEMALLDLGRTQLKPFLMRIWGSPGGVENESGSQSLLTSTNSTTQLNMEKDIHNFLRANASDCMQIPNTSGAFLINNQTPSPFDRPDSFNSPLESTNHMFDNASSYSTDSKITVNSPLQWDESILSNKNVLKDLETLIGNMEQNQQTQNVNVLRSIHDMITNLNTKSENDYDPETMRILTKSPIVSSKLKTSLNNSNPENDCDIKDFVWQHIQEIMPNLVKQVELELVEGSEIGSKSREEATQIETTTLVKQTVAMPPPPPIDQEEFLMEEVIKPNIKNASIREELPPQFIYTAEIETFKLAFDKALRLEHEDELQFETLAEAPRQIYKMFQNENVQDEEEPLDLITEIKLNSENYSQGGKAENVFQSESEPHAIDEKTAKNQEYTSIRAFDMQNKTKELPTNNDQSQSEKLSTSYENVKEALSQTKTSSNSASENDESVTLVEKLNSVSAKISPHSEEISNLSDLTANNDLDLPAENKLNQTFLPALQEMAITVEAKSENDILTAEERFQIKPAESSTKVNSSAQQIESRANTSEYTTNVNFSPIESSNSYLKFHSNLQLDNQSETFYEESNSISNHTSPSYEINSLEDISNLTKSFSSSSKLSTQNEEISLIESKTISNETTPIGNKKFSKIPVRRTASNKSIINFSIPKSATKNDLIEVITPKDLNIKAAEEGKTMLPSLANMEQTNNLITGDEPEDEEQTQTHSTTSEMFLLIQSDGLENTSSIAPSTSSSTLHSTISQTSSFKPSAEFIPSGDPSKQNLSELVKDTQRLIKQMKDEISIDDFESSTDDDAYSDEFSDEYDDVDEEDWGEEEEESENNEEYDDITEDFTEENEPFSIEEDSISQTQSPSPSQESQDRITVTNSSTLSHTPESSNHSLAFSNEHFEQKIPKDTNNNDTINQNTFANETAAVAEIESNLKDLSVEITVAYNLENSPSSLLFLESENNLSELPVETILSHNIAEDIESSTQNNSKSPNDTKDKTSFKDATIDKDLASTSNSTELILENNIPELPVESVLTEESIKKNNQDIQDHALNNNRESVSILLLLKNTQNVESFSSDSNAVKSISKNSSNSQNDLTPETSGENSTKETTGKQSSQTEILNANKETNSISVQIDASADEGLPSTSSDKNILSVSFQSASDKPDSNIAGAAEKNNDNTPSTSKSVNYTQTKAKAKEAVKASTKKSVSISRIPKPKEIPKEQKQKETPKVKQQNDLKKKLYTRSKSFSGPTTPIGIASVKTISQKFISPTTNSQTKATKKQPTVTRKSSIVETISKFTKPSSTSPEKPAANFLFKSRTQPRIPKKKYHETCFSDDDYESSSAEEEIEPLEVRQRKLSVPIFKAYPSVKEPEEIKTEELVERFIKEELATNVAEAQIAATLVSMKFPQDVSLWAAKECTDLDHAIALLKQECELCSGTYALNQIVSMLKCTHKCCKQCAKTYFTVQITERSINDCSCPFCKRPELHSQTEHEDENLEYFSNLDIFLKNIVEPEVHELFQRKLRDRTLLKDPNFKWCVQCSSGFFARPKQKRLICPDCGSVTCAQCRKLWQKQHEGISCEQFLKWESANDPEVQAKGLQQHLEQNGIDCPKCKFKYSLARGGCMHFTCTQCKYEFCYGCAKPFMMGAKCTISPYCAKLGLHAHHPRNCLFYLRDKLPVQLQILLKNNNVTFEVDPIDISDVDNKPSSSRKKELHCPIPIQKETPTGLVDTRCNGDVPEKHAGMCRNHYVEYLTAKVAKAKIDPLPIFDLTDCVQELRRRGLALPERGPWDTDEIYKNMCIEVIKKNIPLGMD